MELTDSERRKEIRKIVLKHFGDESPEAREKVSEIANAISRRYGLKPEELPLAFLRKTMTESHAEYSPHLKAITVDPNFSDGNALGEEYGHYVRDELHPEGPFAVMEGAKREKSVSEFFGYLGRRLAFESLSPEVRKRYFPKGVTPPNSRKEELELIRKLRQKTREIEEATKRNPTELQEIILKQGMLKLKDLREQILTHHRGYNYAARLDLSKIANWERVYSMPDAEVRKRFFREDQDYSGLGYDHRPISLEQAVATAAIISLAGSLFFLLPYITGNSILEANKSSSLISALLFVLGIVLFSIYLRRK